MSLHPEAPVQNIATPELGETLRVVSRDTATLRFQWNSRVYVLPPGSEVYMPFDGVKCYCGDPRATALTKTLRDSIGIVSFLPDRATEVRRLRLLYMAPFGEYMAADSAGGIFQQPPSAVSPTGAAAFDNVRVPQVEVYNIQGQRILTVLDDPDGDSVIPITQTTGQQAAYEAALAHQQQLINVMAERLGIDPATGGLLNAPNVTADVPPEDFETHEDGTPVMEYDQRDDKIKPRRKAAVEDPTTIDDLPEDGS